MHQLITNIRFYILLVSLLLSVGIYFLLMNVIPSGSLQTIRLEQTYGYLAISYLYVAVLITPLTSILSSEPIRQKLLKARRALGVSAFYFSLLHGLIAFFGQLDGIRGITFLTDTYRISLLFGTVALIVLLLMAATSFDWAVQKLTIKRWKMLHRLVYPAALLILGHIFLISTHFNGFGSANTLVLVMLLIVLAGLEAIRIDRKLLINKSIATKIGPVTAAASALSISLVLYIMIAGPQGVLRSRQASVSTSQLAGNSQSTGERYTASLRASNLEPNGINRLGFTIFDANSGFPITPFGNNIASFKVAAVSVDLNNFIESPLQRTASNRELAADMEFPKAGFYILFVSFVDQGQQHTLALSTEVGKGGQVTAPERQLQTTATVNGASLSATLKNQTGGQLAITATDGQQIAVIRALAIQVEDYKYVVFNGSNFENNVINLQSDMRMRGVYRVFASVVIDGKPETAIFTMEVK